MANTGQTAAKSGAKTEAPSASKLAARYLEKVLGVTRVGSAFFESAAAISEPPVTGGTLQFPIKCWLIDFQPSDLPSIREMATKLLAAIEAEWVKKGLSGQVAVQWLTDESYLQAAQIGQETSLVLFFGEVPFNDRSHSQSSVGVMLPRLSEMHQNPALKRDAWRKIQTEIANFN